MSTPADPPAAAVPLVELLRRVPTDARLVIENGPYSTSYIPVGRYCHEAANALATKPAEPLGVYKGDGYHKCETCGAEPRFHVGAARVCVSPIPPPLS